MNKNFKVIVSGGGTGGHIFPAVAIANALQKKFPEIEILFIGAEGRMEMEKVPAAGYKIIGLPVIGMKRKLSPQNIT
ncbi:MAG: glycosyltransferase, partial [Bacteroidales bacterium]|nr:glycosyltransferase [Bacteroidales bacterium]